jgi:spermidine synthase
MVCHATLYNRRPGSGQLTEFYVFMSLGGVLGGAFAALAAPQLFVTVVEYPLMMLAALLARPGMFRTPANGWLRDAGLVLAIGIAAAAPGLLFGANVPASHGLTFVLAIMMLCGLMLWQAANPARLVALAGAALLLTHVYQPGMGPTTYARSFFGVHKTVDLDNGAVRILFHGTTIHGAEKLRDAKGAAIVSGPPEQLTYFYNGGPFSQGIAAVRARNGGVFNRVGLVGLGVGALACYGLPGERWSFYEIDPVVVRIATDPTKFRTMDSCAKGAPIHLGDARLTLADETEKFDLIIIDAFTSDVVPVHLLTREAFALYASMLTPHGAIALNITNRNIELTTVVAGSAAENGLAMFDKRDLSAPDFDTTYKARAEVAVVTREAGDVDSMLTAQAGWRRVEQDKSVRIWTDDYSNIVSAIWRRFDTPLWPTAAKQ